MNCLSLNDAPQDVLAISKDHPQLLADSLPSIFTRADTLLILLGLHRLVNLLSAMSKSGLLNDCNL